MTCASHRSSALGSPVERQSRRTSRESGRTKRICEKATKRPKLPRSALIMLKDMLARHSALGEDGMEVLSCAGEGLQSPSGQPHLRDAPPRSRRWPSLRRRWTAWSVEVLVVVVVRSRERESLQAVAAGAT